MKVETGHTITIFSAGVLVGCVIGGFAWHMDDGHRASADPDGQRVDWCFIDSFRSGVGDDPLGPEPLHWGLRGHRPGDKYRSDAKVVDTGDTREQMVAKAQALGCPLHEPPPSSW